MCDDCGCGLPGEKPAGISGHPSHEHGHDHNQGHHHHHGHEHSHGPGHHHGHDHPHAHSHDHDEDDATDEVASIPSQPAGERRAIEVRQAILARNDRQAERNRGFFHGRSLLALNVLSSPGSGKTTFLRATASALNGRLKTSVIVGDLATDNDAQRLRESGAPVVQITTGTVCHLDAEMVARALKELNPPGPGLLIIENVGNLVCPASYDLGEDLRAVLLSVTEGEDKPLKYPPMFQSADVVVISKMDLAAPCDYQRDTAMANIKRVAPNARIFEISARSGLGMEAWLSFLIEKQAAKNPL